MPGRGARGRTPVRVGLATGAIVAISLTVPVSASLAATGDSAQRRPAETEQQTPEADPASPTDASVPADPAAGAPVEPPGAEEPPSQSADGTAGGSGGSAEPADEPAEPAEPASATGAPEAKPIPASRPASVDPSGETAAPAGLDVPATASVAEINDEPEELIPDEESSSETAPPLLTADTSAGLHRDADLQRAVSHRFAPPAFARALDGRPTCLAGAVSCAALQPDRVELRIRPSRHSARPRAEKAGRHGDGARRNLPVRMPRAPGGAVCVTSSACAAGALGMMPVLAALGCLCAPIFQRLLVADAWRPHRFVSLRERPG